MISRATLLFAAACAVLAQTPVLNPFLPVSPFPADLKQYLSLTDSQVQTILQINSDYNRAVADKMSGIASVQQELAAEVAKPQLDPMAIGIRYGSMELLRRAITDLQKTTQAKVVAVLSDAQKTKLNSLNDALKLQLVIASAQCENLLAATTVPTAALRNGDFSGLIGTGTIGGVISGVPFVSCGPVFSPLPAPLTGQNQ